MTTAALALKMKIDYAVIGKNEIRTARWRMALSLEVNAVEMILIYIFLVLSFGMHEAAHAKAAEFFGDTQPAEDGVATWNPIPHIRRSFFSSIILPAVTWFLFQFFIGGAFVRLNPANLKNRRWGYAAAVAAGPFMNLFLSIAAGLLAVLIAILTGKAWSPAVIVMVVTGSFNFFGFVFNLLPFPPLDGSTVIRAAFPATESFFRSLQGFPIFILFLIGTQIPPLSAALFFPVKLYDDVLTRIINSLNL